MENPILLVDINQWQEVDFAVLKANGVTGVILTINDYRGFPEIEQNFISKYNAAVAAGLIVLAYLVYTPVYSVDKYYNFLLGAMPTGLKGLLIDTEIEWSGGSSTDYAAVYEKLTDKLKTVWNVVPYTGEWFLPNLAYWPKDLPYWWSQYPYTLYPQPSQKWTWDQVRSALTKYSGPLNANAVPSGKCLMWQVTGDTIIVPGCDSEIDIDVFMGTLDELKSFAYGGAISPPVITLGDELIKSEQWYDGCLYEQWDVHTKHGTIHTHLITFDRSKVQEFFVTPAPTSPHYVTRWMELFPQYDIGINLDQFVGTTMGGFNASHGVPYGMYHQNEEAVNFIEKDTNRMALKLPPISIPSNLWNAYALPNIIVQNGIIPQHIYDINALKGHRPRTASGMSQDETKEYWFLVDGDETYDITSESGLDFVETAAFMIRHGVYTGRMHDGGGSETLVRNLGGKITVVNQARGEDYVAQYNAHLRRVSNALLVKMKATVTPNQPPAESLTGTLWVEGSAPASIKLEPE